MQAIDNAAIMEKVNAPEAQAAILAAAEERIPPHLYCMLGRERTLQVLVTDERGRMIEKLLQEQEGR